MAITNITKINDGKTLSFDKFIKTVDELKALDLKDEYQAAAALLFTLAAFETDVEEAKKMFEYINGPEDMSGFDLSFIKNQFSQYPYVVRSYFVGASIDNNYEVKEVSLTIKENLYSRNEENYVTFLIKSAGADHERQFKLRKKPSTGEWFLFADSYKGLLAGIQAPKAADKWA